MALDGFPHERCAVNEHVFILRVNETLPSPYLLYFILSTSEIKTTLFNIASSKAAQPGLNQSEVSQIQIPLPSPNDIKRFHSTTSPIMHQVASNALESRVLSFIRDSLLPKLLSGEIDVSTLVL